MRQLETKEKQVPRATEEYLSRGMAKIADLSRRHQHESRNFTKNLLAQRLRVRETCRGARGELAVLRKGLGAVDLKSFNETVDESNGVNKLRAVLAEL